MRGVPRKNLTGSYLIFLDHFKTRIISTFFSMVYVKPGNLTVDIVLNGLEFLFLVLVFP